MINIAQVAQVLIHVVVEINMNKQGFSIVELVAYIGMATLLMVVVANVSIALVQHRERATIYREVDIQAMRIVQEITDTVRAANGITVPARGTSSTVSLTLSLANGVRNPVVYTVVSNTLYMSEAGGAAQAMHNQQVRIVSTTFENLSRTGTPGVVSLQFLLEYVSPDDSPVRSFSRTIYATASLRQ